MNKIIYSLKVMEQLVERGFTPLTSMPNPRFPNFQCWIFEVTDRFNVELDKILGKEKDNHGK